MPPIRPPPESGTSTQSSAGRSSSSSSPIVPWPAITSGSSNGETKVRPRSAASCLATTSASSWLRPTIWTSAPSACTASTLFCGTSGDMQTTAGMAWARAAWATARAWLPVETATTPRSRSTSSSWSIRLVAPRSLKAPVCCWVSSLRWTFWPRRPLSVSERTSGVLRMKGAIAWRARQIVLWVISAISRVHSRSRARRDNRRA